MPCAAFPQGAPQVDRGRWRSCAANAKCAGNFIAKLRAPPMLHEAQVARQDVFVHISAVERSALTFARRQGQPPRCLVPQSWAGRSHCSNTSAMRCTPMMSLRYIERMAWSAIASVQGQLDNAVVSGSARYAEPAAVGRLHATGDFVCGELRSILCGKVRTKVVRFLLCRVKGKPKLCQCFGGG